MLKHVQVWKAMDAISDKGLQSYLQHHWVIMKMTPADDQSAETANPQNQAAIDPCSTAKQVDESPTCSPELSRATVPSQKKQKTQVHLEGIDDAPNNEDQPPAPQSDGMTGMISSGMQMDADAQSTDHISTTEQRIVQEGPLGDRLLESESANTKLSTETKLDPEQAQDLQPDKDHGLQLARDGQLWFLRIDRSNPQANPIQIELWTCGAIVFERNSCIKQSHGQGLSQSMCKLSAITVDWSLPRFDIENHGADLMKLTSGLPVGLLKTRSSLSKRGTSIMLPKLRSLSR